MCCYHWRGAVDTLPFCLRSAGTAPSPSGKAGDCKSPTVGSIPTGASNPTVLGFGLWVVRVWKRAAPWWEPPALISGSVPRALLPESGEIVVCGAGAGIIDPDDGGVAVPRSRLLDHGDAATARPLIDLQIRVPVW